jgi:hypothetical protein
MKIPKKIKIMRKIKKKRRIKMMILKMKIVEMIQIIKR